MMFLFFLLLGLYFVSFAFLVSAFALSFDSIVDIPLYQGLSFNAVNATVSSFQLAYLQTLIKYSRLITRAEKREMNKNKSNENENGETEEMMKTIKMTLRDRISILRKILIPLHTRDEMSYYFEIGVGNPPQRFTILPDTGSSDFWIPSMECQSPSCTRRGRNLYDSIKSSTFRTVYDDGSSSDYNDNYGDVEMDTVDVMDSRSDHGGGARRRNFFLAYKDGDASGHVSQDFIRIGALSPFYATFGEVTEEFGESFSVQTYDGILGLGFKELANIPNNPLFPLMASNFVFENWTFSLWIGKRTSPKRPSGILTLGGINQKLFTGPLMWIPVMRQSYWIVRLDKASMNGMSVIASGESRAIIDSGTSMMVIPVKTAEKIFRIIKAKASEDTPGLYNVNCDSIDRLPVLRFTLHQLGFELMPRDYVTKLDGSCIVTIIPEQVEEEDGYISWILGSVFLQKYFTAYDMNKNAIGFAVPAVINL